MKYILTYVIGHVNAAKTFNTAQCRRLFLQELVKKYPNASYATSDIPTKEKKCL